MGLSRLVYYTVCLLPCYTAFLIPPSSPRCSPQSRPLQPLFALTDPTPPKAPLEKDVLVTDRNIDYVPLANMLMTGDYKGADQFTRDILIKLAGPEAEKRKYVYWTEVKTIPIPDLVTIDSLWSKYSKGKFGYRTQRKIWRGAKVREDFERFCREIGWNKMENGVERKLKWFGNSEFIYDAEKAPDGHLPLTSALRGTSLLKSLLQHPAWDTEAPKHDQ